MPITDIDLNEEINFNLRKKNLKFNILVVL